MGKRQPRPAGYNPPLQFLIRREVEGGDVASPARFADDIAAAGRRSCTIMVHGFNNNDGEAAAAYLGFRRRQIDGFGQTTDALDAMLGDAFWPGDAAWGWFDWVDFGVYSGAIGHAHATARELMALLARMPNLLEVNFIGHSLGCRVILEAIYHLRESARVPKVGLVCLMAAAVPMEKLEPGGDFHDMLGELSLEGTKILILHSRQDKVLHFAFPLGQAMGGPGERSSRALGREGPNALVPGYKGTLDEMQMAGADHGDYWGHSSKEIARESAERAGRFLGFDDGGRDIGSRRTAFES